MHEGHREQRRLADDVDTAHLHALLRTVLEVSGEMLAVIDTEADPPRLVAATAVVDENMGEPVVGTDLGARAPAEVQAYLWQVVRRAAADGPQHVDGRWGEADPGQIGAFRSIWRPVLSGGGGTARYVVTRSEPLARPPIGSDAAGLEAVLAATSAERRRIAQHIHDDTVQVLSALTLELELLRRRVDPDGEHGVGRLRDRLQHANRRVRDVVTDLDPGSAAGVAVGDAVRDRMQAAAVVAGVALVVQDRVAEPLPPAVAEALYWIATEAVGNALRHAGTDQVVVTMTVRNGSVVLSVTDRGCGFVPTEVPADRFGLRSMQARAHRVGGTLGISSTPTGTTVAATLPLGPLPPAGAPTPLAEDIATALRHLDTDLELAWTAAPVGIVLVDRQGLITRANPAAGVLLGSPIDRLVGRPLTAVAHGALVSDGAAVRAGEVERAAGVVPPVGRDGARLRYQLSRVGAPAGPPWLSVLVVDRLEA
ncbi:MAG: histidine kinase [Acidimicrobiales bacterium]